MTSAPLSQTAEDYLKEVYKLQVEQGRATTSALAERVGVSAPSATAMLKKLAALGLVQHEPYRGVRLTSAGEKAAVEVIRHHRLLEQYLSETLGLPIDEVHAEADRLEHVLSEELEARIDESLGYPTHDPHGDPIPDANLELPRGAGRSLADLHEGESATVRRVPDADTGLLRYLSDLGLVPGEDVELVRAEPFGGPLTVLAGGGEHAVARELAARIGVS
ncbi:MAG: DtxR family transcriptional regulator [Candidatus Rokuibacteriota bacterium]|nr:MAG: DtxR family transcriptional regulator [Candidatus Rokubacteria bacterium]